MNILLDQSAKREMEQIVSESHPWNKEKFYVLSSIYNLNKEQKMEQSQNKGLRSLTIALGKIGDEFSKDSSDEYVEDDSGGHLQVINTRHH